LLGSELDQKQRGRSIVGASGNMIDGSFQALVDAITYC
jgi:hypothetical protein